MKLSIIMLTVHLNYLLLLLSLFVTVRSFPTGSLNEKNQDVSWEAWLLVDDQNQSQNKQAYEHRDLLPPKRRIVPKSVFVAPTFSLENLPPCADGYSSDAMGRCVKIFKLDESKHLDFLMHKLNVQFGSSLDYDTILEEPNSQQPTKVDIPLFGDYDVDYTNDTPEEELDMAIIVTPTTRDIDKTEDSSKVGKRDDKLEQDGFEEQLRKLLKDGTTTTDAATTTLQSDTEPYTEQITTSTVTAQETTTAEADTSTVTESTSIATVVTITTTEMPSTSDSPTEPTITPTESSTTTTTTTPKITTYHPVATTYHPFVDLSFVGGGSSKTRNLVRFPMDDSPIARSHPDGNFVRFPDVDVKIQQEGVSHHTRDVDHQTGNFFNEIVTVQPSERIQQVAFPPTGFPDQRPPASLVSQKKPKQGPFTLPPKWSLENPKPIVLRSLPMDDLTYLFGYKNRQGSHNR